MQYRITVTSEKSTVRIQDYPFGRPTNPMSSRTPTECIELTIDSSASDEDRKDAIHALKQANECDELAHLVQTESLEDRFRHQALEALATPQCDSTLRDLSEGELSDRELREKASDLLER
ncbi:hypothetical protein [Halosimplex amylolyticum]|uniref:hypothetical protein n=1 Tax=Halosimplex amylolyticum TaxID=3396616 RepID=UPI003F56E7EF